MSEKENVYVVCLVYVWGVLPVVRGACEVYPFSALEVSASPLLLRTFPRQVLGQSYFSSTIAHLHLEVVSALQ